MQEYLVDMYSRMVDQRVMYWGGTECQGRIASYREWDEANQDGYADADIGRTFLPAGLNGNAKKSSQQVQNALKLVDVYGKADFFITIVFN